MSTMTRNHAIMLIALFAGLFGSSMVMADDLTDVTAANNRFYVALSARDADIMAKVYAHEPYVANIEPGRSGLEIGWPGVEKWARSQRWPALSRQRFAFDKWIPCRLVP